MKWLADQTERLAKSKKNGYKKFLKYLGDYYFNDSASFNPGYYQYFDSILNGNMVTSTNCLERINRNLKDAAAGGFLPLGRVCRVLQTWKHHYMSEHEDRVIGDNLHRRRSTTVSREIILTKIFRLKIGSINKIISNTDSLLTETVQLETELEK